MKKFQLLPLLLFVIVVLAMNTTTFAQSEPVMFFCEVYDAYDGEIGVSDRFTTGFLTVMVKCDYALNLTAVSIQFDKYNFRTSKFEYYKKFPFDVQPDMKYIYFSRNENSDLEFEEAGLYRVYLLDSRDKTVASALIEIIN
jgi:hypothetical protein